MQGSALHDHLGMSRRFARFLVGTGAMAAMALIAPGLVLIGFFLGILPGMPHLPFLMLAAGTGGVAYLSRQQRQQTAAREYRPGFDSPSSRL